MVSPSPTRRRALWALLALVAAALAATGVDEYLHSQDFRKRLETFVLAQIERGSGARTEVSSLQLSFRPLRLELNGLVLHGREPLGQPPLAVIPRLQVDISIVSLWRRQLALTRVVMQQPRFHIYRLADGAANLPQPNAPNQRHQQEASVLFDLGAKRLQISGGELDLADHQVPLNLTLEDLTLRMAAAPKTTFTGELGFHQSAMRLGALPPLPVAADLRFTLRPSDLRLDEVRLETPGLHATAQGWLRHFLKPQLDLDFQAEADLSRFMAALGARESLPSGGVKGAGQLQWSADTWTARGDMTLSGGHWMPAGPGAWRGQAVWQASPAGLQVSKLDLSGLGASLQLRGRNDRWRLFDFAGSVAGLRLGALRPLLPRLGMARAWLPVFDAVDSRIQGTFQLRTARPRTTTQDRFTAALTLEPGSSPGTLPLAGAVRADFAPSAGALSLRQLDLTLANTQLEASGNLQHGAGTLQVSFNSPEVAALRAVAAPGLAAAAAGQALRDLGGAV
ncbi:MAG: AsmA family protein, partial [Terriglobales bacterium]